ncbi:hypothetical protein L1887_58034 [Cichorium endivia]|nr:hypothetical protein L1887_58034 [Cichorium endivia]
MELLARHTHVDRGLGADGVRPATAEEAPRDIVVDTLVVAREIAGVRCGVDGRMRLVVVPAVARAFKCAVEQALRNATPGAVGGLLGDERVEVELLVELIRLCAWIREEALLIQRLGDVQDAFGREAQQTRARLLQLDRGERIGLPLFGLLAVDIVDCRQWAGATEVAKDLYGELVEEMAAIPVEYDLADLIRRIVGRRIAAGHAAGLVELQQPEGLGHELDHLVVPIDDESKRRELAGSVADHLARLVEGGDVVLECECLHAGEGGTDAQVELDARFDGVGGAPIELDGVLAGGVDLRVDDGREARAHDADVAAHLAHLGDDLAADVLSLAIAIGPDHERVGVARLVAQIQADGLGIIADVGQDGCCKEVGGRARVPGLVLGSKVCIGEMAAHRGDGHVDHALHSGHAVLKVIVAAELVLAGTVGRMTACKDSGDTLGDRGLLSHTEDAHGFDRRCRSTAACAPEQPTPGVQARDRMILQDPQSSAYGPKEPECQGIDREVAAPEDKDASRCMS